MPVILGPTASGKTHLAAHFARRHNGVVISADSRQVYRGMDIGTGKDFDAYQVDGQTVPYRLIDIRDAGDRYHIHDFCLDFADAYEAILDVGQLPILCGGSGLYLEAAMKGLPLASIPVDEALRAELHPLSKEMLAQRLSAYPAHARAHADTSTHKRLIRAIEVARHIAQHGLPAQQPPPFSPVIFGLDIPTEVRRARITFRLKERLATGMMEEVEGLLQQGLTPAQLAYYGLEYKWLTAFLTGEVDFNTMFARLNTAIHQFAKRQMTWFRKMERDGWHIHWIPATWPIEQQLAAMEGAFPPA